MQTFFYDVIDSTNDEARRLLADGRAGSVACVVAREQTHGRGTQDHTWCSPRDGGIYLSVIRRVDRACTVDPRQITPALGTVCADLLRSASGADIELRGVNDLYAQGRKLGGLLTEAFATGNRVTAIIVGIGVNVRKNAVRLPTNQPVRPISLEDLTPNRTWTPEEVVALAHDLAARTADSLCKLIEARTGG